MNLFRRKKKQPEVVPLKETPTADSNEGKTSGGIVEEAIQYKVPSSENGSGATHVRTTQEYMDFSLPRSIHTDSKRHYRAPPNRDAAEYPNDQEFHTSKTICVECGASVGHNICYCRRHCPPPIAEETETYLTTYTCYDPNCKGGSSCKQWSSRSACGGYDACNGALTMTSTDPIGRNVPPAPEAVMSTTTCTTTSHPLQPVYGQPTGYCQPVYGQPTGYCQPVYGQPTGQPVYNQITYSQSTGYAQPMYGQMQLNGPNAGQLLVTNTEEQHSRNQLAMGQPYLVNRRRLPVMANGVPVVIPTPQKNVLTMAATKKLALR